MTLWAVICFADFENHDTLACTDGQFNSLSVFAAPCVVCCRV
jgi:hypothetical protein